MFAAEFVYSSAPTVNIDTGPSRWGAARGSGVGVGVALDPPQADTATASAHAASAASGNLRRAAAGVERRQTGKRRRINDLAGDPDQRALAAAVAVAAVHGLAPDHPTVVYSGSNVMVHLRPAPVLARVMTGTVVLHDDPRTWLGREISVLEFLTPSGLAVAPSPLIASGPHHHDGLWLTFSQWIPDVVASAPHLDDAHLLGQTLRDLHDELQPFDGDLGDLRALRGDIERLHGRLRPSDTRQAAAISVLAARLAELRDVVFEAMLPAQALHGDVSLTNLLATPHRLVWNDFEDTFRGPVLWDLAGYVISLRAHGATPRFVRGMLDAYGWNDEQELAPFIAAHRVYDEIWQMYDRQRRFTSA